MTFATYTPAGPAGTGRGGTRQRNTPALWLVLHTSEGGEGPNSAENLAAFIRSSASGSNVASYQAITDTNRILQIMGDDMRCHGAAGANDQGLHLCFPGVTRQTPSQWFDDTTGAYLEQAARWCADKCRSHNIQPMRLYARDLKAGTRGICGHNDVRLAFGQTSHTDPEPNFPWDWFISRVRQLLAATQPPPSEDDVLYVIRDRSDNHVWVSTGVQRYELPSQAAYDALIFVAATNGAPLPALVDIDHDQLGGFGRPL